MKKLLKTIVLSSVIFFASFVTVFAAGSDIYQMVRNAANTGNNLLLLPHPGVATNGAIFFDGATMLPKWGPLGSGLVISGSSLAVGNVPQSSVTDLISDMADKQDQATSLDDIATVPSISSDMLGLFASNTTQDAVDAMNLEVADITDFPTDVSFFVNDAGYLTTASLTGYVPNTRTVNGHALSSNVTVTASDVGLGNVDNTSDANKPVSILQAASIATKFNTPSGTTAQYVRGDGTLATLPTPGTGTITSVTAGTGLSGGTITTTGTISMPNTGTAGTYSGVTTDAQGRVTAGTNRTQSSASRSLNTCYQVSSTRDALVNYSVDIATSSTLLGGQTGTVFLEIYSNSSCTIGTQELSRFVNGNSVSLAIAITVTQTNTGTITGFVPAGSYVQLRTANTVGTPTFNYRSGQEVLF